MKLSVYKAYDTPASAKIQFYDEKEKKIVGHITYNIWEKEDIGHIASTYLDEEHRKKGIIEQILPKVFCDMKCKLPTINKIHLHASQPKIWERFGFKETGSGNMIRDYRGNDCSCRCEVNKLIDDEVDENMPIQSEKRIRYILGND